jgi:P-type E1-E2 ATPase
MTASPQLAPDTTRSNQTRAGVAQAGAGGLPSSTLTGLTEAEAKRRIAERGQPQRHRAVRSYGSIVRANVFTVPNVVLMVLGGITLWLGQARDALFLGIVLVNATFGSVQEIRAKRALDRLAALVKPTAHVVRDGAVREVAVREIVPDDLVRLQPGDQVVADGTVVAADALRLDESVLTGESVSVGRHQGDEIRSGSFCVEGAGIYVVTAVGSKSWAEQLAGQARAFRHPISPFRHGLNRIVVGLVALGIPLVGVFVLAEWIKDTPFRTALPAVIAGAVQLVPEGLILLTSIVAVTGALKLSRHGALVQQLSAVESLASSEVVCTDKTGTLTEARLRVSGLLPAQGFTEDEFARLLGRYAASEEARNATLEAIADSFPAEAAKVIERVPFTSRRRWSALAFADGTYVLGAPELFALGGLEGPAAVEAAGGRRVVALARADDPLGNPDEGPPPARVVGLALLAERLRPATIETVAYMTKEGIELRVLSGDAPATVNAIAADAGIVLKGAALDGDNLPEEGEALRVALRESAVVGRISPDGKRRVVQALADDGLVPTMIGDGVNDVPALKASRVAIAQGSGTQIARTVSDIVLVQGDFDAVPLMIAEGRQILRNMARVSKIYVAKALVGALTIVFLGLAPIPYPFLPRHLTLASFFVTGAVPFFIALAPSSGSWRLTTYLRDTVRFAAPAGLAIAIGVAATYAVAFEAFEIRLAGARVIATTVFIASFLWMVVCLEATDARRASWVGALCLTMLGIYVLTLYVPPLQETFGLVAPTALEAGLAAAGTALSAGLLALFGIRPRPNRITTA